VCGARCTHCSFDSVTSDLGPRWPCACTGAHCTCFGFDCVTSDLGPLPGPVCGARCTCCGFDCVTSDLGPRWPYPDHVCACTGAHCTCCSFDSVTSYLGPPCWCSVSVWWIGTASSLLRGISSKCPFPSSGPLSVHSLLSRRETLPVSACLRCVFVPYVCLCYHCVRLCVCATSAFVRRVPCLCLCERGFGFMVATVLSLESTAQSTLWSASSQLGDLLTEPPTGACC